MNSSLLPDPRPRIARHALSWLQASPAGAEELRLPAGHRPRPRYGSAGGLARPPRRSIEAGSPWTRPGHAPSVRRPAAPGLGQALARAAGAGPRRRALAEPGAAASDPALH